MIRLLCVVLAVTPSICLAGGLKDRTVTMALRLEFFDRETGPAVEVNYTPTHWLEFAVSASVNIKPRSAWTGRLIMPWERWAVHAGVELADRGLVVHSYSGWDSSNERAQGFTEAWWLRPVVGLTYVHPSGFYFRGDLGPHGFRLNGECWETDYHGNKIACDDIPSGHVTLAAGWAL